MGRRAFVVVLDACGVGALPDAPDYGDAGADTLGHLAEALGGLELPTLERLGLGNVARIAGLDRSPAPAVHGRLHASGVGKDSTAGHWELMGVISDHAPPTYPEGVSPELEERLVKATGRGILGNEACNGVEAIERWGAEQLIGGDLIVYTSVDSVLQIAAHTDRVGEQELYAICGAVRSVMEGQNAVGRVIARPFEGEPGHFTRTLGRRDFALAPPSRSYLDAAQAAGVPVHAVGKVNDLFSGRGIDAAHAGALNEEAIESTDRLLASLDTGLVFVNLVETDQVYGHRKDAEGFGRALERIDLAVEGWLDRLGPDDLLVLTADHGCDVTTPGTDHTREYVPLLAVWDGHDGRRHDGPLCDVGANAHRWLTGSDAPELPGSAFVR
jgi:phosphopentomutase